MQVECHLSRQVITQGDFLHHHLKIKHCGNSEYKFTNITNSRIETHNYLNFLFLVDFRRARVDNFKIVWKLPPQPEVITCDSPQPPPFFLILIITNGAISRRKHILLVENEIFVLRERFTKFRMF